MELKAENRKTVDRVTKVRFKAGITRSGSKINIIYLHFMNTIYKPDFPLQNFNFFRSLRYNILFHGNSAS